MQIALCNASPFAMQRFHLALWSMHGVHRQIFGISLHLGLKPWTNSICPYRAFSKVNTHQVLRANEGI